MLERRGDGHAELVVSGGPHHRLDLSALDALVDDAEALHRDPPRSLVVEGGSRAFCVGVDPEVFVASRDPFALVGEAEARAVAVRFRGLLDALTGLHCPTVAAVVGPAFGGGFELALACDVRIAAPTASFALPELRLGVLPGGGATQRLPRLVGPARAKQLVLASHRLRGDEAAAIGVVDELVPREEVPAHAAPSAVARHVGPLAGAQNWK